MKEFESKSSITEMVDSSIEKIKTLVEANTIVGDSIKSIEGTTIIPISKLSVGFVTGGGEYSDFSSRRLANHYPMAGGSGGGISVTPVGFLIDNGSEVKFISVEKKEFNDTIFGLANKIINKLEEKYEKQ